MKDRKRQMSASITIEAALVLPIFIFAVYTFLYFFCILQLQEDLHYAASHTCEVVSSYGGVIEDFLAEDIQDEEIDFSEVVIDEFMDKILDTVILRMMVSAKIDHLSLADSCIKGGVTGISFLGSSLSDTDDCVTIVMSYRVHIPLVGINKLSFPVIQRVSVRNFTGHYVASRLTKQEGEEGEDGEEEDPIVYITKNGTVYHLSSSCTYIKRDVTSVLYGQIGSRRNKNGAKYYPCENCCAREKLGLNSLVYITAYGTSYHARSGCSQIERTVIEKRLSEVQGMRPCSKCGK